MLLNIDTTKMNKSTKVLPPMFTTSKLPTLEKSEFGRNGTMKSKIEMNYDESAGKSVKQDLDMLLDELGSNDVPNLASPVNLKPLPHIRNRTEAFNTKFSNADLERDDLSNDSIQNIIDNSNQHAPNA